MLPKSNDTKEKRSLWKHNSPVEALGGLKTCATDKNLQVYEQQFISGPWKTQRQMRNMMVADGSCGQRRVGDLTDESCCDLSVIYFE